MSCSDGICPIHGTRYMKTIKIGFDGQGRIRYCAGCHQGEMAVRAEYERGLIYHLYDETGRIRRE